MLVLLAEPLFLQLYSRAVFSLRRAQMECRRLLMLMLLLLLLLLFVTSIAVVGNLDVEAVAAQRRVMLAHLS